MPSLLVLALAFRHIAATVDGGAWLVSQDGTDTVLERVIVDGGRLPVKLEGLDRIDAIATRGEALWIVTPTAVVMRTGWSAKAKTIRVEIPTSVQRSDSIVRDPDVTPLGIGRALVMRACPGATSRIDDCTEVITVDTVLGTATTRTWPVQLSNAVADERGGAWMRVEHTAGSDVQALGSIGYAHATSENVWDVWSFNGMIVPGMMAHAKSSAFPVQLAPAADGFVGISQHVIWPIDENGVPRSRAEYDEVGFRGVSVVHGAASAGGELVLLTGIHESCCTPEEEEYDDVSPVLRWISRTGGVERAADIAPTPSWWREAHRKGTPTAKFAMAGGVAWILFDDLVMMRAPLADDGHEWRVVAERDRTTEADPIGSRHFWSFTGTFGYSRAGDDGGFARGVRFERMRTANRKRPHFGTGGYAEVASLGGRVTAGSGLSVGLMRIGAVASAGASLIQDENDAWHPQFVFSLFLGKRILLDDASLEAPVGVRFELRPGTDSLPTTFMVATSLDMLVVTAVGLLAAAM